MVAEEALINFEPFASKKTSKVNICKHHQMLSAPWTDCVNRLEESQQRSGHANRRATLAVIVAAGHETIGDSDRFILKFQKPE